VVKKRGYEQGKCKLKFVVLIMGGTTFGAGEPNRAKPILLCYVVSERKLGFFVKVKSKIPHFERGKIKILTAGIH